MVAAQLTSTSFAVEPAVEPARRHDLVPHAHAVCRACGRISDLPLLPSEPELLKALADGRPEGWAADGITFTVTGTCPNCLGTSRSAAASSQ
ncbi:MAG: hypothetical protein L3K09_06645 [Thermoplasmata archaeon]|nr:hypothetical protein [Thermoplasmata archaeon]